MLSRVFKGRAERIRRENKSKGKCKETFSNFICSIYIYIYIYLSSLQLWVERLDRMNVELSLRVGLETAHKSIQIRTNHAGGGAQCLRRSVKQLNLVRIGF